MKEFTIKIKTLTIDNYDQMMNLWKGAGLESRPRGRDSKKSIKAQMEVNPEFFIRTFIDNKLIGTVIASSDGRKGWINRLAVSPEHRQ